MDLIKEFVDQQSKLNDYVANKKVSRAQAQYEKLTKLYAKINSSDLDTVHKQIAYDQLRKSYEDVLNIEEHETKAKAHKKFEHKRLDAALIGALAILIVAVLFIKPEFIGLAILGEPEFSELIDFNSDSGDSFDVLLKGNPESIKVSGFLEGVGSAKVYYLNNGEKMLVASIEKDKNIGNAALIETGVSGVSFEAVCVETCEVKGTGNNAKFLVEVDNARLYLSRITYTADTSGNHPPRWTGSSDTLTVTAGSTTNFDLTNYFHDSDGTELVFLATSKKNIDVRVTGDILSITPKPGLSGQREISIIASDLITVTKVPVKIKLV